jgi:hypothetical protein
MIEALLSLILLTLIIISCQLYTYYQHLIELLEAKLTIGELENDYYHSEEG